MGSQDSKKATSERARTQFYFQYLLLMDRFTRTRQLLGNRKFQHLQSKKVTLVGLGAVGGYALEGLIRAGISEVRLVDFDTVQPSNINRQILALENTLGKPKVEAARERGLAINPHCRIKPLQLFAGEETLDEILSPPPDLLIDAIDSLNPKSQLLTTAFHLGIPIISSMGAALRTDPLLIKTGDLFDTTGCPLARHLRKRLRKRNVIRGISCVYSTEKINFDYKKAQEDTGEIIIGETPFADRGRKRNNLGSLPTITGIFGLIVANMAILRLSSREEKD